jgi:adenylate kinase family enzyme
MKMYVPRLAEIIVWKWLPKAMCRFTTVPIKISVSFFIEIKEWWILKIKKGKTSKQRKKKKRSVLENWLQRYTAETKGIIITKTDKLKKVVEMENTRRVILLGCTNYLSSLTLINILRESIMKISMLPLSIVSSKVLLS